MDSNTCMCVCMCVCVDRDNEKGRREEGGVERRRGEGFRQQQHSPCGKSSRCVCQCHCLCLVCARHTHTHTHIHTHTHTQLTTSKSEENDRSPSPSSPISSLNKSLFYLCLHVCACEKRARDSASSKKTVGKCSCIFMYLCLFMCVLQVLCGCSQSAEGQEKKAKKAKNIIKGKELVKENPPKNIERRGTETTHSLTTTSTTSSKTQGEGERKRSRRKEGRKKPW